MSLNIPENATEIFNRMAVDIAIQLDDLDPFLKASFIKSLTVSDSNAIFELYKTLQQLENETFWDTATGEALERWAAIYGITRNPATKATGFVTFTGINGTTIPMGTQFTAESGSFYETLSSPTITTNDLSVSTLTRVSSSVTVTTAIDHGLASNMEVVISGAVETDYNGTFVIVVTGLNTFTYTISTTPTTPATGTILATATFSNVDAISIDFGSALNLSSGSKVSLASPVIGVDSTGYVSFDEISGGTDLESDSDLRDRFLFRVQNPIALFNNSAIEDQAKQVPGVTRVFVQNVDFLDSSVTATSVTRSGDFAIFTTSGSHGLFDGQVISVSGAVETDYNVTDVKILVISATEFGYVVANTPSTPATGTIIASFGVSAVGQVRIFFMRDNDADPIPTTSEVDTVRSKILEIKPAPTSSTDVIVSAPTAVTVPFTFTAISPSTADMQSAISDSLTSFFSSGTSVAQDVTKLEFDSVIISTIDNAGNRLQSFTLSTPTADISIGVSEIAVLGAVTFV